MAIRTSIVRKLATFFKNKSTIFFSAFVLFCTGITFDKFIVPKSFNAATQAFSESIGVDFSSNLWSIDWSSSMVKGSDILIRTPLHETPILEIEELAFQFSKWKLLTGGWRDSIQKVNLIEPRLHLERDLAGIWNWESLIDKQMLVSVVSNQLESEDTLPIRLQQLQVNDMRIDWFENQSITNENGIASRSNSELNFDDVNMTISDLVWPYSDKQNQQLFHLESRIASGRLILNGKGNLLNWRQPTPKEALDTGSELVWNPEVNGNVVLENIPAESLWRILPSNFVQAESGQISGETRFSLKNGIDLSIAANLEMNYVRYRQLVSIDGKPSNKIYEANSNGQTQFEGDLSNPKFQPLALLLSATAEDSMRGANEEFQLVAAQQTSQFQAGVTAESVDRLHSKRPATVQNVVSLAVSHNIADKYRDKLGEDGARLLGELAGSLFADTEEGSSNSDDDEADKKGTIVGNALVSTGRGIASTTKKTIRWFGNLGDKDKDKDKDE